MSRRAEPREQSADRPSALVTGASEGLGRAFARGLAAGGYRVTTVARNESRLQQLAEELGDDGHPYVVADLCTASGVTEVASALASGQFDLLVNNAGLGCFGNFVDVEQSRAQQMIRLNCEALVTLSYAFLNAAREGTALINVSGILGLLPVPGMSVYAGTKALNLLFSQALWHEQKARGIYVMCLVPGPIATRFQARSGATPDQGPPAGLLQSPEQIVERALRALRKRRAPVVVASARRTRLLFGLLSRLPRKTALRFMARFH